MRTGPLVVVFSLLSLSSYAQESKTQLPESVTTVNPEGKEAQVPAFDQEHDGSHTNPWTRDAAPPSQQVLPDGLRLGDEDRLEVYVDVEGRIYQRRTYQGVVPNLNNDAAFSETVKKHVQAQKGTKIMWVGFQQRLAASRVFIQLDRTVKHFSLYKPTPTTIAVDFPRSRVPLKNNQRELLTGNFQTPVKTVRVIEDKKSGTSRIIIHLKEPVGYIYRQDGPYVYVDIER